MVTHKGSAGAPWTGGTKGAGHSCFENLFGLGMCSTRGGREMNGKGTLVTPTFRQGTCQKVVHVDKRIRFLWTRCAPGGRGSRLSSPLHAGG